MNSRNKWLLGLLVVQLAVIFFLYRPVPQGMSLAGEPMFPGLAAEDVLAVTIEDEEGGQLRIARVGSQEWHIETARPGRGADPAVTAALPLPADGSRVEKFLRQVAGLATTELATRTRSSQTRLQVADGHFARRVTLQLRDGRSADLFLGSAPSHKSVHARRGGEDEVYLAAGVTPWEADPAPATWWQQQYLNLDPGKLQALTVVNRHGRFTLRRDEEQVWRLAGAGAGEEIDAGLLENFLAKSGQLQLFDYRGREDSVAERAVGLVPPDAQIFYEAGGQEITLRIGAEDQESGLRVVKSSASPYYVRMHSSALAAILDQEGSDLLGSKGQP